MYNNPMMVTQETTMKNRQLKRKKTYNLINSSPNSNLNLKQSKYHNTNIKEEIKSLCKHTNFGRLLLLLQTIIFSSRSNNFYKQQNMNHYNSLKIELSRLRPFSICITIWEVKGQITENQTRKVLLLIINS